jgi:hypothetical protein
MAKDLNIDFNQAVDIIEQEVHAIKISLLKGQRIILDQIGVLYNNKENSVIFEPSNEVNYLGDSFGLPRFTSSAISRSSATGAMINRPVVKKTIRWAAVLVPIATVALWSALNTGTLNNVYNNYASIIPTAFESAPGTTNTKTIERNDLFPASKTVKEVIEGNNVKNTTPKVVEAEKYFIIAGAFGVPENAMKLVEQLKVNGYNASVIGENGRKLHLVSIEGFSNKQAASNKLAQLHQKGFPSAWILTKGL